MESLQKAHFHERVVRESFKKGLGDEATLLLFGILHCYEIELSAPVLSDCPNLVAGSELAALTQRGCGAAVAEMWAGEDDERASYVFWYHRWQHWGSYPRLESLTDDERARMRWLVGQLDRHPFVARVVPEDADIDPAGVGVAS